MLLNMSEGDFLQSVKSEEKILAYISAPCASLSLFATLLIFVALFKESTKVHPDSIWKPRIIFESLSLFNTTIGTGISAYGFFFLYHRNFGGHIDSASITVQIMSYLFIFHRFLLIGGDLFPSMDRCMAILYPMKYYCLASPKKAFGVYLIWMLISAMLTLVTWAIEIVPTTPDPSMDYAPFFILANHRFVIMISIPYLFVLGLVFTCDIIALLIAIVRKNQMTTPTISSCNALRNMSLPTHLKTNNIHSGSILDQGKSNASHSITVSMDSPIRRMATSNDLKFTIRCLSLTTWYFVSQIAIFLPGIIYFGCDMETDSEHDLFNACGKILTLENTEVHDEVWIQDEFNFIGTVGGSFGLFIGFSYARFGSMILDYFMRHSAM